MEELLADENKTFIYVEVTKIATAQNEVTLSYHRVRGLCFLAIIFAATVFSVYL